MPFEYKHIPDVECPYCGEGQEICHDDGQGYEESEVHQQECGKCDKIFAFTTSISFDYEVSKADCLNGEPHKWKPMPSIPFYPNRVVCGDCGEEKAGEVDRAAVEEMDERIARRRKQLDFP